jgi:hypothetical protein
MLLRYAKGNWNTVRGGGNIMDKRTAALIIMDALDRKAPVFIDWCKKDRWLKAIEEGLKEVEKTETPAAGTVGESR